MQALSNPMPMTVITGYLGSGKTTFVNAILARAAGRRIMILVNDFGEISLDEALISNRDGDVISLANGCMCCQIGGDLYRTIDRILSMSEKIDHLVVETSGVADPSKISQIALAEPELILNGTLCLIDAENFAAQLADPVLQDTLERQIKNSDRLLLTKTDLGRDDVSEEMIADAVLALREIGPDSVLYQSRDEARESLLSDDVLGGVGLKPRAMALKTHIVPFDSWSWKGNVPVDRAALLALLDQNDLGIYRAKGIFCFENDQGETINKVGARILTEPLSKPPATSILTVIGKRSEFNRARFEEAWKTMLSR